MWGLDRLAFKKDEGFVAEGYVRWKNLMGVHAGSLGALDEWMDILQQEAETGLPLIAEVERHDGKVLYIGLGRMDAALSYAATPFPPYYVSSAGRPPAANDQLIDYYFYGIWIGVPLRHMVPMANARAALRFFWETGERSKEVLWEKYEERFEAAEYDRVAGYQ
jgi:hypothetical protein